MDLTLRPPPKLTGLKWAPSERKPGWALSAPPALCSYLKSPPLEGLTTYIHYQQHNTTIKVIADRQTDILTYRAKSVSVLPKPKTIIYIRKASGKSKLI